jgi:hypothetical protein
VREEVTENNIIEKQASETPKATAFMRAMAASAPCGEIKGND